MGLFLEAARGRLTWSLGGLTRARGHRVGDAGFSGLPSSCSPLRFATCSAGTEKSRLRLRISVTSGYRRQIRTSSSIQAGVESPGLYFFSGQKSGKEMRAGQDAPSRSYLKWDGRSPECSAANRQQDVMQSTFSRAPRVVRLHLHLMVPPVSTSGSDCLRTHRELKSGRKRGLKAAAK